MIEAFFEIAGLGLREFLFSIVYYIPIFLFTLNPILSSHYGRERFNETGGISFLHECRFFKHFNHPILGYPFLGYFLLSLFHLLSFPTSTFNLTLVNNCNFRYGEYTQNCKWRYRL